MRVMHGGFITCHLPYVKKNCLYIYWQNNLMIICIQTFLIGRECMSDQKRAQQKKLSEKANL